MCGCAGEVGVVLGRELFPGLRKFEVRVDGGGVAVRFWFRFRTT